jgi:membrane protease subunit (stomatin/prohibitin family)
VYPGSSSTSFAPFIGLIVIALVLGLIVLAWRVSLARRLAADAGLSKGAATALTVMGNPGLDATFIASSLRAQQAAAAPAESQGASAGVAGRLNQLEALRDQGLLSESEYQARRAKILDSI